jgi:G3E family GTPase
MPAAPTPLPVTVVSGFAGAGKTSLCQHLLARARGKRVKLLAADGVGLPQGCLCCERRDELIEAVRQLAAEGSCDYLLIEAGGSAEPLPIAESFCFEDEHGQDLSEVARLDTLVTVVDAERFLADWKGEQSLSEREGSGADDDQRCVADLLVEQIEFANVLVLNKLDRVSAEDAERTEALLRQLNPEARLVRAEQGAVPLEAVMDTELFDFEQTQQAPGWLAALRGEAPPSDERLGLGSFVYRARVPFHPQRFWDLISEGSAWQGVLRSKGFFWLATRMSVAGSWSHAGGSASCEGAGLWYAAVPSTDWPDEPEQLEQIREDWQEPWGDRRQEIAFFGVDLDSAALSAQLDSALLQPAELAGGAAAWVQLDDPFPDWAGHEPVPESAATS